LTRYQDKGLVRPRSLTAAFSAGTEGVTSRLCSPLWLPILVSPNPPCPRDRCAIAELLGAGTSLFQIPPAAGLGPQPRPFWAPVSEFSKPGCPPPRRVTAGPWPSRSRLSTAAFPTDASRRSLPEFVTPARSISHWPTSAGCQSTHGAIMSRWTFCAAERVPEERTQTECADTNGTLRGGGTSLSRMQTARHHAAQPPYYAARATCLRRNASGGPLIAGGTNINPPRSACGFQPAFSHSHPATRGGALTPFRRAKGDRLARDSGTSFLQCASVGKRIRAPIIGRFEEGLVP
jgi:hypothetical protein